MLICKKLAGSFLSQPVCDAISLNKLSYLISNYLTNVFIILASTRIPAVALVSQQMAPLALKANSSLSGFNQTNVDLSLF